MKLENLKDLKGIIALCRKTGVKSIEIDGVKLELGDAPHRSIKPADATPDTEEITSDVPTAEEMLFWSTQDAPSIADKDN
jgi:hypothetical protein